MFPEAETADKKAAAAKRSKEEKVEKLTHHLYQIAGITIPVRDLRLAVVRSRTFARVSNTLWGKLHPECHKLTFFRHPSVFLVRQGESKQR